MSDDSYSSVVNSKAKGAALLALLAAYRPMDYAAYIENNNLDMSVKDFTTALPAGLATDLTEDACGLLLASDTPGEFFVNGFAMIGSIISTMSRLMPVTNMQQLEQLVTALERYHGSADGSVTEVQTQRTIAQITDDIDENAVKRFPTLVAGWQDPEHGFEAHAIKSLNGEDIDDPEDDGEDEEEDDALPAIKPDRPRLNG